MGIITINIIILGFFGENTPSGKVVVNAETSEETRELYEILKNNVE